MGGVRRSSAGHGTEDWGWARSGAGAGGRPPAAGPGAEGRHLEPLATACCRENPPLGLCCRRRNRATADPRPRPRALTPALRFWPLPATVALYNSAPVTRKSILLSNCGTAAVLASREPR